MPASPGVPAPIAVKFVPGHSDRLNILAIPFGGPEELGGVDLDGEYFSAKTDWCPSWFPTSRPLLYHHGLHPDTDAAPVGKVDSTTAYTDEVGVWVQAELDKQAAYYEHIRRMVADRKLFASSGAMPHLVRKSRNAEGAVHIDRWPWVELSLTPTPANPLALVSAGQAKSHYKAAGLTPPPTIDTELPYLERVDRVTDDAAELLDLTRRLTEGRVKVGRPQLSDARRRRLAALIDEFSAFLRETEPRAEQGAEAEADTEAAAPASDQQPEQKARPAAQTDTEPDAAAPQQPPAAGHAPELVDLYRSFQALDTLYGQFAAPGPVPTTTTARR